MSDCADVKAALSLHLVLIWHNVFVFVFVFFTLCTSKSEKKKAVANLNSFKLNKI